MFRNVYAILVFFILASLSAFAYGQDAQIQGQVLDTTGAGIPKAIIRVSDQQTGTERKIESNEAGQYTVSGLASGAYRVIVEAPGFSPAGSDQIMLAAGQSAVYDFTLKIGTASTDIVVTAEKRGEELLKDVPIPISVLNAAQLADSDQTQIRDYYNTVPSFTMVANYGDRQNLAIRGITTGGFSNPTVGVTVDDVPFGASTSNADSNEVPDIDPGDLDRIEVLRGPQGTLYGASSMGGLIRYVTKGASLDGFSGRIEAGSEGIHNGSGLGYNFRGSANLPVSRTSAIRVSAYTRANPGYIDNPVAHLDGVNSLNNSGGRLAALWDPSDKITIKLGAMYQRTKIDGSSDVFIPTTGAPETIGLGDLQQNYIPGTGSSEREVQAYDANITANLGWSSLTSVTGYNSNKFANFYDRTVALTPLLGAAIQRDFGVNGIIGNDNNNIKNFSQEFRLASLAGAKLEWQIGGFYSREESRVIQDLIAANRTTGQVKGIEYVRDLPYLLQEEAAFGTLTYRFTDKFDVQAGGRYSHNSEHDSPYIQSGPFIGATPVVSAVLNQNSDTFTHLLAARYKPSADAMFYARWSSGYRAGGPNFPAPGAPSNYAPDTTQNYEVGFKGDFFKHVLSIDASLYYIDWKDLQISLRTPASFTYITNGSRAKSEGLEFSATIRPWTGMAMTGWYALDDAVLTETFPGGSTAFGLKGDRLPNSARNSGYLSAKQEILLRDGVRVHLGGDVAYTGDRVSVFTGNSVRQIFPAYTKLNLQAGVQFGTWTGNVYVNNVADKRGVLAGGISYQPAYAFSYIQPRTAGISIAKTF